MNRFAVMGLLLVAGLSGCLPNDFIAPDKDKTAAKPIDPQRPINRPPVAAGQINAENARDKAQALREELDRDMEQAIAANDVKPEKK
jgi:hypothetical protein